MFGLTRSGRPLLRVIQASGWQGDVGILSHIAEADAAETLARNLAGYDRLLAALADGTVR